MNATAERYIDSRGRIEPVLPVVNIVEGETIKSSDTRIMEVFGEMPTAAGAVVTPISSMRVSAVYACVRLIAGVLAGLPKEFFRRVDVRTTDMVMHDFWWLLNERFCALFSAAQGWEYVAAMVMLRGDCICYIVRNRNGWPIAIIPWPRDQVIIKKIKGATIRDQARLEYYFCDEGQYFGAQADDVLHFSGFGFDGEKSMSVIQWGARNGIGIAMRSDEFAGKFFGQGAQPQFAVTATGKMSTDQQNSFRESWVRKYSGNGPNGIPLILTEGLDVKQLTMTATDAQLLESRQFQIVDIARAFGVPPHMIGEMGKATYNNTENLGVDVVKYTFGPIVTRWEQELNIKFFRTATYFVRMNVDGLQRGDLTARGNYYKSASGGTQAPGWMTPNEIRQRENLPPLPDGNTLSKPKENSNAQPQQPSDDPERSTEPAGAAAAE